MKLIPFAIVIFFFSVSVVFSSCAKQSVTQSPIEGSQSKIIREMIEAVNEKDAEKYVKDFAQTVRVFVGTEMKVDGRDALRTNRGNHFENYPNVRSKIMYLVEIDNKVIMHDKVWLKETNTTGQDIVEIFTFENGKVIRVDVIQSKDLFQ